MDELIRKQDALDAIHCDITVTGRQNAELVAATIGAFADRIKALPTVQPNTSELINRIRSEINSKNRNSADYFIVDRIERIVNEWENEHGTDSN